jgi:hypothetical protein
MPFPAQFVRAVDYYYPTLFGPPPAREQPSVLPKRIFVFRQKRRLDSTTGASETMERILIFDNHPETLQLLFGRGAITWADPEAEEGTRWWEPIRGWMLVGGVSILLLLSLFLIFRS